MTETRAGLVRAPMDEDATGSRSPGPDGGSGRPDRWVGLASPHRADTTASFLHKTGLHKTGLRKTAARPESRNPSSSPGAAAVIAAQLAQIGTVITLPRGRTIIAEGEPADCVFGTLGGTLRCVRFLPDGRRYIPDFLLPGSVFGVADDGYYRQTVEAVSDTVLIRSARRRFDALLERDPRVARRIFNLLRDELATAHERMLLLGRRNATERLATFLLEMAERLSGGTRATEVALPMTRIDIADHLGLTIETVSRLFTRLRRRRILALPTLGRVSFLKREILESLAAEGAPAPSRPIAARHA